MSISIETILLVLSILFFISLVVGKAGSKYGVPILLLFLGVGMLAGVDGWGIVFDSYRIAQTIGTIALTVILFSGGMDTKIQEIRPVILPGVILATVGVLLTAFITGLLSWLFFDFLLGAREIGFLTCLLLAAVISSTDSASVFSILRSKGIGLKNNLRPLLELESGSNDPMAYMLTMCLISIINMPGEVSYLGVTFSLITQFIIGSLSGYLIGRLTVFIANHIKIDNPSLYPIFIFTSAIFAFSFTHFIKGNGFLAVYISGMMIGNAKMIHKRSGMRFFDGLAWLSQILMFLTLGLLVNPHELMRINVIVPGLIISVLMIFVTRPASVFISLFPLRNMTNKDKLFVSWVGLRGAVPIIFAIMPLAAGVAQARFVFNTVFFITLVSLLVQGTTLTKLAKKLGLDEKPFEQKKLEEFDLEFPDDIKSLTSEITVNEKALCFGNKLMDLPLPDKTVVVLLKRNEKYLVPNGDTHVHLNDILLVITDDEEALTQTYQNMGII